MKNANSNQYLPFETYKEAIDTLENFTILILFSFTKHSTDIKDIIIRNLIARAIVSLKGIVKLWEVNDYQDCWVVNRCILDRLFHLETLARNNTFELFEKWSFKKQYDFSNKIRSDKDFKNKINSDFFKDTTERKEKYANITKEQPLWKRQNSETVAKNMDLIFLYKFGYDYASTLVHPMANDGEEDFLRLTNLLEEELFTDQRVVLNNSCLAVILLIQKGLNECSLAWHKLIFNFLDDFLGFLRNGSKDYILSFLKISKLGPDVNLAKIQ